ncbi:thermonuclease family protein [Brucella anthropi]|nr:thermonuclease family protein [Ochrobactrum sp. MYb49]
MRIAAIDACEKEQSGLLNGKTWPCGLVARSYLRKMIDGKHVSCRILDVDRYNRSVGQCFLGNTDIGIAMVRAGQAEAMLRYLPRNHGIDIAEYGYAEN